MSALAPRTADMPHSPAARRLPQRAPEAAFAALLALGCVIVLVETRGLSFFGDEWDFVLDRRGLSASVLLTPHNPHLSLIPILIYKVLLKVFGARSYLPFRMLAAFDLMIVALILGIACRARWGRWWGLAPVLLLVTLGPGAVTLLWPFQVGYAISVAAGLISLLALDREWRRADLLCCTALIVSLASASQGIGFIVGTGVMLAIRGDWRRRAWVVVVPAVLYGLWYLKYGQPASETHLSLWNTSLSYSAQALSATIAGALGLSSVSPQTGSLDITFGVPLAVATVAAVGAGCWRGWRPAPIFWGVVTTLVVLWVAASLSDFGPYSRPPGEARYLSSNVALVLVCLCAAVPRPRLARTGVIVAGIVLVVIAATNASQYAQTRANLKTSDVASRADLGALIILRHVVGPSFAPALPGGPAFLGGVKARAFFSAVDSFGLTEDSPASLLAQDETTRESADGVLQRGELSLSPTTSTALPATTLPTVLSGAPRVAGRCLIVGTAPLVIRASAGRYQLTARQRTLTVAMGRFASIYDVPLGTIPAGRTAVAPIPADAAPQIPWRMMLTGAGGQICVT